MFLVYLFSQERKRILKHCFPAPLILYPPFPPFCSEWLPLSEWAVGRHVFVSACWDIQPQYCVSLREPLVLQYHFVSKETQDERCSDLPRLHIWALIWGTKNRIFRPFPHSHIPQCLPIPCSFTLLDYTSCILTLVSHFTDEETVSKRVKQHSHSASKRQ